MNIKLKILLICGGILWVALLITDYIYQNPHKQKEPEVKIEPNPESQGFRQYLSNIFKTSYDKPAVIPKPEVVPPTNMVAFAGSLLAWNLFAFITAVGSLVIIETAKAYIKRLYLKYRNPAVITYAQLNSTYIDTKNNETIPKIKTMENDISTEIMSNTYSTITQTDSRIHSKSGFEKHMERECAKLRDEMIAMQSASIYENDVLNKKLEAVVKEKRELAKQLSAAQKENRAAKRQLEDLLMEKDLLQKRLECADKEFRLNSKMKRNVIEQLEESKAQIEVLKQQVSNYSAEKQRIEKKIEYLDSQYHLLITNRVGDSVAGSKIEPTENPKIPLENNKQDSEIGDNKSENKSEEKTKAAESTMKKIASSETEIKEHTYGYGSEYSNVNENNNTNSPKKVINEVSPSELDMTTMQQKLIKLEQSLEVLRKRKHALKEREKVSSEHKMQTLNAESTTKLNDKDSSNNTEVSVDCTPTNAMSISVQAQQKCQPNQTQTLIVGSVKHDPDCPIVNVATNVKPTLRNKHLKPTGNLTDEQREKIFRPSKRSEKSSDSQTDIESVTDDEEDFTTTTFSEESENDYSDHRKPIFNVPKGFVTTAPAFRKFLEAFNELQYRSGYTNH